MSLFQIANFPAHADDDGRWALWRIDETEPELLAQLNAGCFPMEELQLIRTPQRRLEWLSCRLALQALLADQPPFRLLKNSLGRPYLTEDRGYISLSHAYPFAAAAIHPSRPVGLDVEQPRPQLLRIKHKFLSEREQALAGEDLQQLCLFWAAKEALYKLNGQPGLHFARDMQLIPAAEQRHTIWLNDKSYQLHDYWHGSLLLCVVV